MSRLKNYKSKTLVFLGETNSKSAKKNAQYNLIEKCKEFVISGALNIEEKEIILEVTSRIIESYKTLSKLQHLCTSLKLDNEFYGKYLFTSLNQNSAFDHHNYRNEFMLTDIYYPYAAFRFDIENAIRRLNNNIQGYQHGNKSFYRDVFLDIIDRFISNLHRTINHPFITYHEENTNDKELYSIVPKRISNVFDLHSTNLVKKVYLSLVNFDSNALTDLKKMIEILEGKNVAKYCIHKKQTEEYEAELKSKILEEDGSRGRPENNRCVHETNRVVDEIKEGDMFEECNDRVLGGEYSLKGTCDVFNNMYDSYQGESIIDPDIIKLTSGMRHKRSVVDKSLYSSKTEYVTESNFPITDNEDKNDNSYLVDYSSIFVFLCFVCLLIYKIIKARKIN